MQMAEKSCVLILLQKRDCGIAVSRDMRFQEAIFSIKKIGCVITARDDTEEEVRLWCIQEDLTKNG